VTWDFGGEHNRSSDNDNFLNMMQELLASDLDEADWMVSQGNRHFHNANYQDAINCYDLALELFPNFPVALNNRGRAHFMLEEFDRAQQNYNQAKRLDPHNPLFYFNNGILLNTVKCFEEAIDEFTNGIELCDQFLDPSCFINRGFAYASLGQVSSALKDNLAALAIDDHNLSALNNLGKCYDELGDTAMAIEMFSRIIDIDDSYEPAYDARGKLFYSLGEFDLAIIDYTNAIQASDSFESTVFLHRAWAYRMKGLNILALRDASVSMELEPEEVSIKEQHQAFMRDIHSKNTCDLLC